MEIILVPALKVLWEILRLYWYVVVVWIVMTWLIQFNVINGRNEIVRSIFSLLSQLVEPVLKPIRRRMPPFGAMDLSPIVLFFAIMLIQFVIEEILKRMG